MNLHRIEAFLAVAQARNISQAAMQLDVAQSVVSRHIGALEAELGCRLFERTGRGVSPTAAAEQLAPRLRAALEEMHRAVAEAADLGGQPSGVVRIGVIPAAAQPLVGMLYQRVADRLPRIQLQFVDGFSTTLDERLGNGELDLAVVNRFSRTRLRDEQRLCVVDSLVVGPAGSYKGNYELPFKQLATLPLVLASRPNPLRMALDQLCRREAIGLRVVVEADSMLTLKDLIVRGRLYTVLPYQLVHEELKAGTLSAARLVKPGLPRTLSLALSRRRPSSAAIRAVSRELRDIVETSLVKTLWR